MTKRYKLFYAMIGGDYNPIEAEEVEYNPELHFRFKVGDNNFVLTREDIVGMIRVGRTIKNPMTNLPFSPEEARQLQDFYDRVRISDPTVTELSQLLANPRRQQEPQRPQRPRRPEPQQESQRQQEPQRPQRVRRSATSIAEFLKIEIMGMRTKTVQNITDAAVNIARALDLNFSAPEFTGRVRALHPRTVGRIIALFEQFMTEMNPELVYDDADDI